MDNQHKLIKGCRDLSQAEIDLMNEVKAKASEVGELIERIRERITAQYDARYEDCNYADDDPEQMRLDSADPYQWVQDGKKDLQDGFMKLVRSIAQPTSF